MAIFGEAFGGAMAITTILAATLGLTLTVFFLIWLVSLKLKDASIVDLYWGPGFFVTAATALGFTETVGPRAWMIAVLTAVWGLRLGLHLGVRWRASMAEDPRYAAMRRARGGGFALYSLVVVFALQALIQWLVALPLVFGVVQGGAVPLGPWDLAGLALFAIGFLFETVGDAQLAAFRADPANRGRVLDSGLWKFTRHPNYFGDALVMWGLFFVSAPATGAWWTAFAPALMTVMLVRVSGVRLLEAGLLATKPDYRAYIERTSAFFPWPPKRQGRDERAL